MLTILLLCLMSYQAAGEALHEWLGIAMAVTVIAHHVFNRKWHSALFKGKYGLFRIVTTVTDILLLAAFAMTAFCGMSMSVHAVPFLYGMTKASFARTMHIAMSWWAFVLMGLHIGYHIPSIMKRYRPAKNVRLIITIAAALLSAFGLYLFIRNRIPAYLSFKAHFMFLENDRPAALIIFENALILLFWVFTGSLCAGYMNNRKKSINRSKRR